MYVLVSIYHVKDSKVLNTCSVLTAFRNCYFLFYSSDPDSFLRKSLKLVITTFQLCLVIISVQYL